MFHQELIHKSPRAVHDDIWTFNSQVSSQWDGLRHFAYQKEAKFYNGVTVEQISGKDSKGHKSTVNGIHGKPPSPEDTGLKDRILTGDIAWSEQGIVGRGVLVDYHSWRLENNKAFDAFETSPIPLEDLKACLAAQGTEVKFGDILLIRSGKTNDQPLYRRASD